MYSKKFPSQKRAAILRAKRNDCFVDTSVGGYLNDNVFTPTTDRRNEELENAVDKHALLQVFIMQMPLKT